MDMCDLALGEKNDSKISIKKIFITKPRDEVFEDLDLLSAALEEAKLRKMQNIEKLKSYKLL